MKKKIVSFPLEPGVLTKEVTTHKGNGISLGIERKSVKKISINDITGVPQILVVTSYPPRECGIATYSQDLVRTLNSMFGKSIAVKICALESSEQDLEYPLEVKYTLKTGHATAYEELAKKINEDKSIQIILVQHEFGFFREQEQAFLRFLYETSKPTIIAFHTVLPNPDEVLQSKIQNIVSICESVIVMTKNSAEILSTEYQIPEDKIKVIAHGTHLVLHLSENLLKKKHKLEGRLVLTTFGLISPGKSIETTLEALPAIIKEYPDVMFLLIGKTHPEVKKSEGEAYRESLEKLVKDYSLQDHTMFLNRYLDLPELLEYLQLTDIYLFTSIDPKQAVSGTFAYAMSCACPIISTPIPHATEVLDEDTGVFFDFRDSKQLASTVINLLKDEQARKRLSANVLQKIVATSWGNSAVAHASQIENMLGGTISLGYNPPVIKLDHLEHMTTHMGILQFSKINQPDMESGYTLDDNARALIASIMHYQLTGSKKSLKNIVTYLFFIERCIQPGGNFLNYVDKNLIFTEQNQNTNLDDSNGRAVWALGHVLLSKEILPPEVVLEAKMLIEKTFAHLGTIRSTRSMAFAIKGLYYYQKVYANADVLVLIKEMANRLVQMYKHESSRNWEWFEGYLTYANSVLPEAMLYTWLITGEEIYKDIAKQSFAFLLSRIFNGNGIEVISNKDWLIRGGHHSHTGEQPIDVAYTIMTLCQFYKVFPDNDEYLEKMNTAFNWFLGENRLHQMIYNPCTGGCYDGLEENNVNLNQGAESTVSYLMARLTMEGCR